MSHRDTVRAIYASFGAGDVPAILEHIAENVEWDYAYPDRGIAYMAPRRGRQGVAEFFRAIAETLDFTQFEVKTIVGDDKVVVALCDVGFTVRSTGKSIAEVDEPHIWHFDAQGRVYRFRHGADTAQHVAANTIGPASSAAR